MGGNTPQRRDMTARRPAAGQSFRRAFTVIEILIVVVILGILATVVIPKLSNASQVTAENTLKEDLRYMRTQIQVFRFQHNENMPGRSGEGYDADVFRQQMTMPTDIVGNAGSPNDPDFPYGPYLRRIPTNPLNNKATVQIVDGYGEMPEADSSHGWMYQPETNTFIADMPGVDLVGVAYVNY